jgi:hypothetical protein
MVQTLTPEIKARLDECIIGFQMAKSKGFLTDAEQKDIKQLGERLKVIIHNCNNIEQLKFWELLENAFFAIKKQLYRQEALNNVFHSENIKLKIEMIKSNELVVNVGERLEDILNVSYEKTKKIKACEKENKTLKRTNKRLKNDRKTEKRIIRKSKRINAARERYKARTDGKGH